MVDNNMRDGLRGVLVNIDYCFLCVLSSSFEISNHISDTKINKTVNYCHAQNESIKNMSQLSFSYFGKLTEYCL